MDQPSSAAMHPEAVALFRHAIAALGHRFQVAVQDAPSGFADYLACSGSRTPGQILAHINVLLEWSANVVRDSSERPEEASLDWDQAVSRCFTLLKDFDDAVLAAAGGPFSAERLLQGPLADALTHVGQLTMLRRMAGSPVHAESYFRADIRAGQFGSPIL